MSPRTGVFHLIRSRLSSTRIRLGYLTPTKTKSHSEPGRRHQVEAVHGLLMLSTA